MAANDFLPSSSTRYQITSIPPPPQEAVSRRKGCCIDGRDRGKASKKMTTKSLDMQKCFVNNIHVYPKHPIEDNMHTTAKDLHYSVKETLQVFKDCDTAKIKHKLLHKVVEEWDLKLGKIIYLDIISQKKQSYWGFKNWILVQDSSTKQRKLFLHKVKRIIDRKSHQFTEANGDY